MNKSGIGEGKRITIKRARPNPLFQEWLEELHEEALAKKSKLQPILKEALSSLSKFPLPLQTGSECAILQGFNKKLCLFLDKRLEAYNSGDNVPLTLGSQSFVPLKNSNGSNSRTHSSNSTESETNKKSKTHKSIPTKLISQPNNVTISSNDLSTKGTHSESVPIISTVHNIKSKSHRSYKPAFRSGGYAILVALLEYSKENLSCPGMNKELLIEKAQKHSEESFIRPKPESFYTAWSNMSRLITKGLVNKSRKKQVEYSLTPDGITLANELLIEAATMPTTNDFIFNNIVAFSNNKHITTNSDAEVANSSSESLEENNVVELKAGSYDIMLLIDKNETSGAKKKNDPTVAQFNKYPDLKHEYRSLKIGDFTWIAKHKIERNLELVLPYTVERKRMDDFGSSIKDGRFHEQKFRLRRCGLPNVIYMVENYGSNKYVGLPIQSLMQALANTRIQDGFKVHMTDSLSHSTRFLAMMTKRLTIEYKDKNLRGTNSEPQAGQLMTFAFFNKSSLKTKALTVKETFIKMLLQLKGVSVEKALAITSEYKTPLALIKKYQTCERRQAELLLANLKYGEMGRSVGSVVSKAIYQLLSTWDEES